MTATIEPGSTRAVFSAAPTPVVTPHPINASCSSGRSDSTLTTECCETVIISANVPRPVIAWMSSPFSRRTRGTNITE